jgi:hypothetical protein
VHVAVPQVLFRGRQAREQLRGDDVFHAHDLRVLAVVVEDHALDHIFIQMSAVVMRLHLRFHVAVVEVKAVEVGVERVHG